MVTIALPVSATNATETQDPKIDRSTSFDSLIESAGAEIENGGTEQDEERTSSEEPQWEELYRGLQSFARYLVNTLPIPYWYGREADIADDITQETMRRLLERIQKAERGEAQPIKRVRQMMTTIAANYYRDLKRHERRLSRLEHYAPTSEPFNEGETVAYLSGGRSEQIDLDSIVEKVDQEALFSRVAKLIERFPKKQRTALLIDLANRMFFDERPTALQAAFQEAGIDMQHYQQPLPTVKRERSQHISLLSQANKRVSRLLKQIDAKEGEKMA